MQRQAGKNSQIMGEAGIEAKGAWTVHLKRHGEEYIEDSEGTSFARCRFSFATCFSTPCGNSDLTVIRILDYH